jgi:para-nitrobenzyl esterase
MLSIGPTRSVVYEENDMSDATGSSTATSTDAPVVDTSLGPVQGREQDGIHAFLGIPYAAPPFGALRMRPPAPHEPWDGVRDATRYGPTVPKSQYPPPTDQWLQDPEIPGEDCLNLNVWTPDLSSTAGLPVFVWIYGGGFTQGANSIPMYAGTKFARDGVVGVTINYRLGADGFLATGDGIANCALLDMVAALEWVRDNIAAFGGDPDRVTIAGESAGALAVYALMAMPRAEGLFSRAIAQSGGPVSQSAETAQRVARWLAAKLGIEPTREAFAAAPVDELLAAQQALSSALRSHQTDPAEWGPEGAPPLPFGPVIDGDVLPGSIASRLAAGASAGVMLLAGSNRDEDRLFLAPTGLLQTADDATVEASAKRMGLSDAGLAAFRASRPGASPADLLVAIGTDARFRRPAIGVAEHRFGGPAPTFFYEFAWPSPAFGGIFGACHALEIPFAFDNLEKGGRLAGDAPPQELADAMHSAWVGFAERGDPGWPPYDPERRATMTFDMPDSHVVDDPRAGEREAWAPKP